MCGDRKLDDVRPVEDPNPCAGTITKGLPLTGAPIDVCNSRKLWPVGHGHGRADDRDRTVERSKVPRRRRRGKSNLENA